MVRAFPTPGVQVRHAYRELDKAVNGDDDYRLALGDLNDLPRPWSPATCTAVPLRVELWNWLDAVVIWINHELVFDPADVIPACWPQHPHLVHELAVLADRRREADRSLTSDALEEWHRYALPAFLVRMEHRVAQHCQDLHPPVPPAAGRLTRHLDGPHFTERRHTYEDDIAVATGYADSNPDRWTPLRMVDTGTGEFAE